jgi:hypothetical protein
VQTSRRACLSDWIRLLRRRLPRSVARRLPRTTDPGIWACTSVAPSFTRPAGIWAGSRACRSTAASLWLRQLSAHSSPSSA